MTEYLESPSAPANSWAYGDSTNDLPLLGWVSHGAMVQRGQLVTLVDDPKRVVGQASLQMHGQ